MAWREIKLENQPAKGKNEILKSICSFVIALWLSGTATVWGAETSPQVFPAFKTIALDGAAGKFFPTNGGFYLSGASTNEGLFFAYLPFAHNGQISARFQRRRQNAAKVGIIFRQTLERNSAQGGMFFSGDKILFERSPDGKSPSIVTVKTNDSAQWLRVVREGSAVSGFYSTDGTNWIAIAADTVEMPENIFLGFAASGTGSAEITDLCITSAYLTAPQPGTKLLVPTNILLEANVAEWHGRKSTVEFFSVPRRIAKITEAPYQFLWTNVLSGANSFLAKVTDETGAEFFTESVDFEIASPPASATFLGVDKVTKGDWKGIYGKTGFLIVNDQTNLPPAIQLAPGNVLAFTWPGSADAEPRALQRANSPGRIVSSWDSRHPIILKLNIADGEKLRLALYFLDCDKKGRTLDVQIFDSAGKSLDRQTVGTFVEGKYLSWLLQGKVVLRITSIGVSNPTVSAFFFDPAP